MTSNIPHIPDAEQIDAYVAGGLPATERAAFEAHLLDCPACSSAVATARATDASLRDLFATARPAAGFEDRLIRAVRQSPAKRGLRLPLPVRRAAAIAASVMLVSGVGYLGNAVLADGQLSKRVKSASNLRQIGQAILMHAKENKDGKAQVYVTPSSNAEKWAFSGGRGTARSWGNWEDNRHSLAYDVETQNRKSGSVALGEPTGKAGEFTPHKTVQDGVLYDDGHVQFQNNPFTGTQRDNIFGPRSGTPLDPTDSILLPTDADGDGIADLWSAAKPAPADYGFGVVKVPEHGSFKPSDYIDSNGTVAGGKDQAELTKLGHGLALKGAFNSFAGATVVNGGTLLMGGQTLAAGTPASGNRSTAAWAVDAPVQRGADAGAAVALQPAPQVAPAPPAPAAVVDTRKIIRNGTMEFEVDSFDSAWAKVSQIVGEAGGFVATTDSQKLPNGKVRGAVTLRVPPERLDVLVLSLRALGDLKGQQISAQDITKQYTDLQSQLTAARAMENRLLELIKSANGQIKDLLAAEKELGVWREKIEKTEGEIRYYNNLVSLSTLTITLQERDIKTPAAVTETETADVGIEAEDVEKSRTDAIAAIEDAKGRVVESELKHLDAGQLAARIVADVPPETAGAAIDRLKQLGRVARLEVHRQQTSADGANATPTTAAPLRVERKPTRLLVSLYNLANVAPRRTTNVTLAATDVESAYAAIIAQAKASGGRVVTSSLDRGDPAKASGSIVLEFPPDKLDVTMMAVRAQGDLLKRTVTQNADTQNTTDAKQGLTVQVVSLASVQPRETLQQVIAATDVPTAYRALIDAINTARARVRVAQLNEQDPQRLNGVLEVEVLRTELPGVEKAIAAAGDPVSRSGARSADAENTVDSKLLLRLSIVAADRLPARESTRMEVEVTDAAKAAGDAQTAAVAAGGTISDATVNRDRSGRQTAHVVIDVPLAKASEVLNQARSAGTVRAIESSRDSRAPAGSLAHARIDVMFATADATVAGETGVWPSIRHGLATSVAGLLLSVKLVVIGLCLVGPWLAVAWVVWKLWKRRRSTVTTGM